MVKAASTLITPDLEGYMKFNISSCDNNTSQGISGLGLITSSDYDYDYDYILQKKLDYDYDTGNVVID